MKNGWTGGQYSVFRAVFGAYLLVHFAALIPYGSELFSSAGVLPGEASPLFRLFPNVLLLSDAPAVVAIVLVAGLATCVALILGWRDRIAAVVLWYILACLVGRNPLILNPSLPFVGWLLLAHAALPPAPYLSLDARNRVDPRGGWQMPSGIAAAAWIVMALGYSYSGWTKLISPSWMDGTALVRVLENPLARPTFLRELLAGMPQSMLALATWGALALELLFAPLALSRRLRPWLWLAMVLMHLGLIVLIDFADLSIGMLMLHLFTFDPAWIPARADAGEKAEVFYDGSCGLCHGAVRFILAEEREERFVYSPLQGERFASIRPQGLELPDSVVLRLPDGSILVESEAALAILERLGGMWRALAIAGRLIPLPLRDGIYRLVARNRKKMFGTRDAACPILPPDLRSRFLT